MLNEKVGRIGNQIGRWGSKGILPNPAITMFMILA
jgi:hypothetical protein